MGLQDCHLVYYMTELAGATFMVFTRTCDNTRKLALMLRNLGLDALPIHGQMSQPTSDTPPLVHQLLHLPLWAPSHLVSCSLFRAVCMFRDSISAERLRVCHGATLGGQMFILRLPMVTAPGPEP